MKKEMKNKEQGFVWGVYGYYCYIVIVGCLRIRDWEIIVELRVSMWFLGLVIYSELVSVLGDGLEVCFEIILYFLCVVY